MELRLGFRPDVRHYAIWLLGDIWLLITSLAPLHAAPVFTRSEFTFPH